MWDENERKKPHLVSCQSCERAFLDFVHLMVLLKVMKIEKHLQQLNPSMGYQFLLLEWFCFGKWGWWIPSDHMMLMFWFSINSMIRIILMMCGKVRYPVEIHWTFLDHDVLHRLPPHPPVFFSFVQVTSYRIRPICIIFYSVFSIRNMIIIMMMCSFLLSIIRTMLL